MRPDGTGIREMVEVFNARDVRPAQANLGGSGPATPGNFDRASL